MNFIPQSSNQGSLFELVARGQKDKFFNSDRADAKWAFNNNYLSSAPFIGERRTTVPLNEPMFGNSFEIEFDKYGDILTECTLLVSLPTWLPPLPLYPDSVPTDPFFANTQYEIRSNDFDTYGYVNYIGYFLFEKIQFYQDQILIQEWSGDALLALGSTEGSWNSTFLDQTAAGMTPPGDRNVARRATPRQLRVKIPLPGLQSPEDGGFPFCCVPSQNYRLRIKLRPLENLVVSSNLSIVKPAPWDVPQYYYTLKDFEGNDANVYSFAPLKRQQIGQPSILLETFQCYIPDDVRNNLQTRTVTIPFRKVFENIFTIGELDYAPLDLGGTAAITRRLDARHIAERIVTFFRTGENLDRNHLDDFFNRFDTEEQSFYSNMKLVIAGRDREHLYGPNVWRDIVAHAKDDRDNGLNLSSIRWNLGDMFDRVKPGPRQPEGGVNFSTADRPTLYLQLRNIPPQPTIGYRNAEMRSLIEVWCVYETQEGRGRQVFGA